MLCEGLNAATVLWQRLAAAAAAQAQAEVEAEMESQVAEPLGSLGRVRAALAPASLLERLLAAIECAQPSARFLA